MHYERQQLDLGPAQLLCTRIIGARSDADIVRHLEEYRLLLLDARERGQKLVDILEIRHATPPTAKQRRMQSDWNTEHEELMRQTLVGFTFVVSSTVMRGIITAIMWIKPLPMPSAVFTDLEEALQWAFERLKASGIPSSWNDRENARRAFGIQTYADVVAAKK